MRLMLEGDPKDDFADVYVHEFYKWDLFAPSEPPDSSMIYVYMDIAEVALFTFLYMDEFQPEIIDKLNSLINRARAQSKRICCYIRQNGPK